MASKKKQAAKEAALAPKVAYPRQMDFFERLFEGIAVAFTAVAIAAFLNSSLPMPYWQKLLAIPAAIPGVFVLSGLLFPSNRHLFTKSQKQRLLFNRELYIGVSVILLGYGYLNGYVDRNYKSVVVLLTVGILVYCGHVLYGLYKSAKNKKEAKDPLGLL